MIFTLMRLFRLKVALLSGCLILGGFVFVAAQDDLFARLTYPIPELGNCANRQACEVYCDKAENMKACLIFAKTHSLLPKEEIEMGQRMLALGTTKGPGGCQGMNECEAYCDQIEHIKECITFAEKNNLIPPDELKEAKMVMKAIDRGLKPPRCKGKKECDVYCSRPENMEECITFAKEAGLMPPAEFQEAAKVLEAIKKGAKPPACAGKKECDIYCSQPEHMEECMEFGIAAGFMPPEEIGNARKTLKAIKQGVRPPNCQGKEECDVYCSQSEHMEECMEFGIAAGFIPPEEIEGARGALKAIKKGIKPPNCQGKEKCDIYCSQPEHMAECLEFGIAAGFMPPEEIDNARKMLEAIKKGVMPPKCQGKEECDVYCSQEEHFEECLNFAEATGFMSPEEAERVRKSGGKGPGGCKTKEECEAFCSKPENADICLDFSVKMGDVSPEEAEQMRQRAASQMPGGPGGCQTPEECQAFCQNPENAQKCLGFAPEGEGSLLPGGQPTPAVSPEGTQPPEGTLPPEGTIAPSPSEQIQEMQQTPPSPPSESPEPISWIIKNLLGNISSIFLK